MVNKINKLIVGLLLVGAAVYVIVLNLSTQTIRLSPGWKISAPAGVIMIGVFAAGVLCCALAAFFFGLRAYWREKSLQSRQRKWERNYDNMLKARSYLASGDWNKAREQWRSIVKRDPSDIAARIELARSLEGSGELKEALKTLDGARAYDPANVEVLFLAAELNVKLGNLTSALDNLALVLEHSPNQKAARFARDLSEKLDQIDRSIEYHILFEDLGGKEEEDVLAKLKLKKIEKEHAADRSELKAELKKLLKASPAFVPALCRLSALCKGEGDVDEAVKLLLKASKLSGDPVYWQEAAQMWLQSGQPDRAVSAARAGVAQASGKERIYSELELAKLYLALNMNSEAKEVIDGLESKMNSEDADEEISRSLIIVKGRCYNALGEYRESARIWQQLIESRFESGHSHIDRKVPPPSYSAPEPRLSTP